MSNTHAHIEKLLQAVAFLSRNHVADHSLIAPTCRSCGENYPCAAVRHAQSAQFFGVAGYGELPIREDEGPEYLADALRHIDQWISNSGDYSADMVEVIDELHRLVIADGVQCIGGSGIDGYCELLIRARVIGRRPIPLWSIATDVDTMYLRVNVAPTTESGRGFLASILMNTIAPFDAEQLLAWWSTLDTCRRRTVTAPLPANSETAVTMLSQLISATYSVTQRLAELTAGGL